MSETPWSTWSLLARTTWTRLRAGIVHLSPENAALRRVRWRICSRKSGHALPLNSAMGKSQRMEVNCRKPSTIRHRIVSPGSVTEFQIHRGQAWTWINVSAPSRLIWRLMIDQTCKISCRTLKGLMRIIWLAMASRAPQTRKAKIIKSLEASWTEDRPLLPLSSQIQSSSMTQWHCRKSKSIMTEGCF